MYVRQQQAALHQRLAVTLPGTMAYLTAAACYRRVFDAGASLPNALWFSALLLVPAFIGIALLIFRPDLRRASRVVITLVLTVVSVLLASASAVSLVSNW